MRCVLCPVLLRIHICVNSMQTLRFISIRPDAERFVLISEKKTLPWHFLAVIFPTFAYMTPKTFCLRTTVKPKLTCRKWSSGAISANGMLTKCRSDWFILIWSSFCVSIFIRCLRSFQTRDELQMDFKPVPLATHLAQLRHYSWNCHPRTIQALKSALSKAS